MLLHGAGTLFWSSDDSLTRPDHSNACQVRVICTPSCAFYGPDDNGSNRYREARQQWSLYIHPEDLEEYNNVVSEAEAKLKEFRVKYRVLVRDGSNLPGQVVWVRDYGEPCFVDGVLQGFVGSVCNITCDVLAQVIMSFCFCLIV